jgi:hypothetical protein
MIIQMGGTSEYIIPSAVDKPRVWVFCCLFSEGAMPAGAITFATLALQTATQTCCLDTAAGGIKAIRILVRVLPVLREQTGRYFFHGSSRAGFFGGRA